MSFGRTAEHKVDICCHATVTLEVGHPASLGQAREAGPAAAAGRAARVAWQELPIHGEPPGTPPGTVPDGLVLKLAASILFLYVSRTAHACMRRPPRGTPVQYFK
jgi:hypothetical protein